MGARATIKEDSKSSCPLVILKRPRQVGRILPKSICDSFRKWAAPNILTAEYMGKLLNLASPWLRPGFSE
jgi:hypothetical protein